MASSDGLSLMPCDGLALSVGGEINKLAFNVAMGRNFAGIHYRSDMMAGFRLGEGAPLVVDAFRSSRPAEHLQWRRFC